MAGLAALIPSLFIPTSVDAYILPRATLVLALGPLLMVLGWLRGGRFGSLGIPALAVALAALAAWAVSPAPSLGLVGAYGRYESVLMRLSYLALFFAAAWLTQPARTTKPGQVAGLARSSRDAVVLGLLLGVGIVSVEALFQAATHAHFVPDGNLGQHNLLGALLAMAIPFALMRALDDWRWWPACGLYAAALLVSASRSAWLGAAAALVLLVLFAAPRRHLRRVLGGGLAGLLLVALLFVATPLRELNHDPGTARIGVWEDSLRVIAARPLLGWGEEGFGLVFGRWQTADWQPGSNFDRAHSVPLDLAASQGLIGLAACAWFWILVWKDLWRRRGLTAAPFAAALGAYTVWGLLNFDWAPVTGVFWLLGGLAVELPPLATRPPGRNLVLLAPALAVAAFALLAQAADIAYFEGDPALAARLDPLQPQYHAAVGTLAQLKLAASLHDPNPATYVRLGQLARDPAQARAYYRRALAIYPFDAQAQALLKQTSGP